MFGRLGAVSTGLTQDAFQVLDGTAGGILRQRGIRGDNQHQRLIAGFFRPFSQVLNFRHHQVPGNQVAHQDDSRIFRRIIPFNGPLAGHHGMEGFTDRHIIVFPLIANPVGNGLVELAYIHVGKRHPVSELPGDTPGQLIQPPTNGLHQSNSGGALPALHWKGHLAGRAAGAGSKTQSSLAVAQPSAVRIVRGGHPGTVQPSKMFANIAAVEPIAAPGDWNDGVSGSVSTG